jgi:hypothetical protein
MLAWFIDIYNSQNALTPEPVLVLFILSVLATVWAFGTLFTYHRSKAHSTFVGFVDLGFFGALIAASYLLRGIGNDNCATIDASPSGSYTESLGVVAYGINVGNVITYDKPCSMLKASWAFGIMNCILFAITGCMALSIRNRNPSVRKETYTRETHVSRHGHRHSGSHRSHRSSHSGRRSAYV